MRRWRWGKPKRRKPGAARAFRLPGFPSPVSLFLVATLPGVLVRVAAQQIFCRLLRVAIFDVHYFRPADGPAGGSVVHERPRRASQQALLVAGPFLVGTVLGALIAAPASIPISRFAEGSPLDVLLLYLGAAIATQSFPAPEEVEAARQSLAARLVPVRRRDAPGRLPRLPLLQLVAWGASDPLFWRKLIWGLFAALIAPAALIRLPV